MPAPLAVDREAVKAHAIIHGLRPAAAAFGLPVPTLAAWSARDKDGPWCPRTPKPIVRARTMQPPANNANSPSVAARMSMAGMLGDTRLSMAVTARKGFRAAARKNGDAIILRAPELKALAGLAQIAHPELREERASSVTISLGYHVGSQPPMLDCAVDEPDRIGP